MIARYLMLCSLVILAAAGAPAGASAQTISRFGGGFAVGLTPNLAEGFSTDQVCPHRSSVSVSARGTYALTRVIQLEALGEVFHGSGIDCVDGLIPPPPSSGPYTFSADYYDGRITEPPTVLALRVGASLPKVGALTLRPYAGIARFSGKGITSPQAGLSVSGSGRRLRLLVEVEGWWYRVPRQHLEEDYFDGQLISRTLTEHDVRTFTTIFRLGFTAPFGR